MGLYRVQYRSVHTSPGAAVEEEVLISMGNDVFQEAGAELTPD